MRCGSIIKKCYGVKGGFRVNSRRFSVRKLRRKFLHLLGLLRRLKFLYEEYRFKSWNLCKKSSGKNIKNNNLGYDRSEYCGIRSLAHSKSFCAEAIADCLDFIKKNSTNSTADYQRQPMLRPKGFN